MKIYVLVKNSGNDSKVEGLTIHCAVSDRDKATIWAQGESGNAFVALELDDVNDIGNPKSPSAHIIMPPTLAKIGALYKRRATGQRFVMESATFEPGVGVFVAERYAHFINGAPNVQRHTFPLSEMIYLDG